MDQKPKILIATPIFPPAIGGPATYAENLARELSFTGHAVAVLSYGSKNPLTAKTGYEIFWVSSRLPSGIKHLIYFFKSLRLLGQSDVVLAFDPFVVGVPIAWACRFRPRPMLLRIEGDFLWETYIERTGREITLRDFNRAVGNLKLNRREKIIRWSCEKVFSRTRFLVFSSAWRRDIFFSGYRADPSKIILLDLAWPRGAAGRDVREKVMVFAGRFVKLKNIERLIGAFLSAADGGWRLEIIGDGPEKDKLLLMASDPNSRGKIDISPPLPQANLIIRLASAHSFLLPSITDVSPNVILECIKTGTPFVLTRESGFYEVLKSVGLFVDPLDENDIEAGIKNLLNAVSYAEYRKRLASFAPSRSWRDVADDWLKLIAKAPR